MVLLEAVEASPDAAGTSTTTIETDITIHVIAYPNVRTDHGVAHHLAEGKGTCVKTETLIGEIAKREGSSPESMILTLAQLVPLNLGSGH